MVEFVYEMGVIGVLKAGVVLYFQAVFSGSCGCIGYPDGIAFDEVGNLWVTFPAWNAVGLITPEGELVIVLEDPQGLILRRPSNICFGWENLETAFIGSLDGTSIPNFRAPYPGMKLIHQ